MIHVKKKYPTCQYCWTKLYTTHWNSKFYREYMKTKALSIYTIKRESLLKNLLKQDCWTISLDLTIYLVLTYISLTI